MSRAALIGSPTPKSHFFTNKPFSSSTYQTTAIFRIRRNKWSIIKFLIFLIIFIYLFIQIRLFLSNKTNEGTSFIKINDVSSKEGSANNVQPLGIAEHLPLIERSNGHDSGRTIDSRHLTEPSRVDHGRLGSSSHPRHRHLPSSATPIVNSRKKKLLLGIPDIKKRKLDEQLKTLLPVVPGWGEDGKGVNLVSESDREKAAKVFQQGGYNVFISDRISSNRTLRPVVAPECNNVQYNIEELPNVSVIIIFTNEIFSALIRTIWSVINRTPKKLLKEIILVDDFSDKDYLKETLQDYIDVYLNTVPREPGETEPLVKLIHLRERLGLIKARLEGARRAKGDVLLFLDSHCETTDLWLEPLVQRIKENNRVFICPVIDIINDKTLGYNAVDPYFFQLGGFEWTGHFTWINRHEADAEKDPTNATKSPTMAGGLFAVDRKYFFEIGSYDEDMEIWGGENLELSFRAWQCGGRVEIHPCSHVGHIFRDFHPYSFNGKDSHGFNTLRTVLVWMDEYSKYFFMQRPDLRNMNSGNISARLDLRKRLQCKSFEWYLENVYDNRKFVYDKNVRAYGWLANRHMDLCVDVLNRQENSGQPVGLYTCDEMKHPLNVTTNQLFSFSSKNEIRREESCLTGSNQLYHPAKSSNEVDEDDTTSDGHPSGKRFRKVKMQSCLEPDYVPSQKREHTLAQHKHQQWRHEPAHPKSKDRLLVNIATGECLTTENGQSFSDLLLTVCDRADPKQYWTFQVYLDET